MFDDNDDDMDVPEVPEMQEVPEVPEVPEGARSSWSSTIEEWKICTKKTEDDLLAIEQNTKAKTTHTQTRWGVKLFKGNLFNIWTRQPTLLLKFNTLFS